MPPFFGGFFRTPLLFVSGAIISRCARSRSSRRGCKGCARLFEEEEQLCPGAGGLGLCAVRALKPVCSPAQ